MPLLLTILTATLLVIAPSPLRKPANRRLEADASYNSFNYRECQRLIL